MARTDTLNNFLTDIAEAIREKEGTTEAISASEFDTRISNLSTGSTEDLTDELSEQENALANQNDIITNIIQALSHKASGGEEYIEPDYIQDGLVAWFDGYDEVTPEGYLLNKVGTDYIYATNASEGNKPHKAYGAKGLTNDMIYKFTMSKDYYNNDYTFEVVGKVCSQHNSSGSTGGWLLAANASMAWGIGVVSAEGNVSVINNSSGTQVEELRTGYYGKRFGAAIYTKNVGTRGGTYQTQIEASIDGSPYYLAQEKSEVGHSSPAQQMSVMCYYIDPKNSNNPYIINGELNCIRIYNRKLTEEEIAHNHEIDKKRFNLHDNEEVK